MHTATVQIRQRGQLTVPVKIRTQLPWLAEKSVVAMEAQGNALIVKPIAYSPLTPAERRRREQEFKRIWADLERFSRKGKQGVNLSQFVIEDRQRH